MWGMARSLFNGNLRCFQLLKVPLRRYEGHYVSRVIPLPAVVVSPAR